jgi:sec-independent protein translocase protein TatA
MINPTALIHLTAMILGVEQWLVILVLVLILFGGKKIPELMRGVGRGVGELQKGLEDGKRALHDSIKEEANRPAEAVAAAQVASEASAPTNPPLAK